MLHNYSWVLIPQIEGEKLENEMEWLLHIFSEFFNQYLHLSSTFTVVVSNFAIVKRLPCETLPLMLYLTTDLPLPDMKTYNNQSFGACTSPALHHPPPF